MDDQSYSLQMTSPKDFLAEIGAWIRAARQQACWTQAMLAARAGVPVSTLSRFEREGLGSTEILARLLFALGRLDTLQTVVSEQRRLAEIPADLTRWKKEFSPPQRIRIRKEKP
jgi:transcriptional regulator with XRE-family HTH domain